MATVYDVKPDVLIERVAEDLRNNVKLKRPEWVSFVKTGAHNERMPEDPGWWEIRAASILRKVYTNGPVGVQRLRTAYGGRKNRGVKPEKFCRAGGSILRTILKEFDGIGFTEKSDKGRKITNKGQSYMDKIATDILRIKKDKKDSRK